MKRTPQKLLLIYAVWIIIWIIVFQFLIKDYLSNLTPLFFIITILLLLKDAYDLSTKQSPWPIPDYFDHAPLAAFISWFFAAINPWLAILALIDFVVDFLDDVHNLKP